MKNPKWSRDELIVTLDFYLCNYPKIPEKNSEEISNLSDMIRKILIKLEVPKDVNFRNKNGVYMKLMNFHHLNPNHLGDGLKRVSKLDQEIWNEFNADRTKLKKISDQICSAVTSNDPLTNDEIIDEFEEAQEGRILTRLHQYRERDSKIIKKKKDCMLKAEGALECEGCGFDFKKTYGEHGLGFIECHHTKPVSEIKAGEKTTLNDLSIICSNCHKMIHRKRPWLTMDQLRKLIHDGANRR